MNKKYLNLILVSAILVIWSVIFVKIFSSDNEVVNNTVNEEINETTLVVIDTLIQFSALKNPFSTPFNTKQQVEIKPKQKPKLPQPKAEPMPNIKLHGIISDLRGKLAILQFPDNSVEFLRQGEKKNNIELVQISEISITIRVDRHCVDLTM